ncbi:MULTISPECIES: hypothetical protein [unclassified Tolypothrix]|nr:MULTISPECIES: hypothetical protein [unclassified Tolypothrix]BAY89658.1 hypothetical protein NIES3275_16610 [Microchaete diplosiphon NIES-3275]EKE97647.1 hypothetical protein FDUTEX481_05025 [Tolypothrix sp. PCC 7601]MBE9083222.1 hypothetical protein [Tolypothrix sp. LEGE 11397]UYD23928.1 hypothetical protein HGR01_20725 [Tolypothrix sp. PCC 7712]UYD33846.1 hypothetical protein HG267_34025 [Tolypothrix sp. PCC 7601]
MSYCKAGDKPTVRYKFGTGNEKTFKSPYAPIEVITKNTPVDATSNYNQQGFRIGLSSINAGNIGLIITDYKFVTAQGILCFIWKACGEYSWGTGSSCPAGSIELAAGCPAHLVTAYSASFYEFNTNVKCPSPNVDKSSIEVRYNGLTIFQDQGNGTVTFDVQCSNCPDGQCECKTSEYPGYCCSDCNSLTGEIATIKSAVKVLNSKGSVSHV